jgi:hypothetical protein
MESLQRFLALTKSRDHVPVFEGVSTGRGLAFEYRHQASLEAVAAARL